MMMIHLSVSLYSAQEYETIEDSSVYGIWCTSRHLRDEAAIVCSNRIISNHPPGKQKYPQKQPVLKHSKHAGEIFQIILCVLPLPEEVCRRIWKGKVWNFLRPVFCERGTIWWSSKKEKNYKKKESSHCWLIEQQHTLIIFVGWCGKCHVSKQPFGSGRNLGVNHHHHRWQL